MPPALAPITPTQLRDVLLAFGYKVERETDYNWSLVKKKKGNGSQPIIDSDPPIIIPKAGNRVSVEIMMNSLLVDAGMNLYTYWELKKKIVPESQNYPELEA